MASRRCGTSTGQALATFEHADVVTSSRSFPAQPRLRHRQPRRHGARVEHDRSRTARARARLAGARARGRDRRRSVAAGTDDSRVTLRARRHRDRCSHGHLGRVLALAFTPTADGSSAAARTPMRSCGTSRPGTQLATLARASTGADSRALAIAPRRRSRSCSSGSTASSCGRSRPRARSRSSTPRSRLDATSRSRADGARDRGGRSTTARSWCGARRARSSRSARVGRAYNAVAYSPDGGRARRGRHGVAECGPSTTTSSADVDVTLEAPGVVSGRVTADGSRVVTAGDDGRARDLGRGKGKLLGTRDAHDAADQRARARRRHAVDRRAQDGRSTRGTCASRSAAAEIATRSCAQARAWRARRG